MTRWTPLAALLIALVGGVVAVGVDVPAVEVHEVAEVSAESEAEEATALDRPSAGPASDGAETPADVPAPTPSWAAGPTSPPPE